MPELSPEFLVSQLQLREQHHIVLALSGGLDSMVLLDLLARAQHQQPFNLQAVYIDHGISKYASAWGDFCAQQCAQRAIAFTQCHVELSGRDNLEAKARSARYQALANYIHSKQHMLLTAHHSDDQLETLFLALKRGAGIAGLSGIAEQRDFSSGSLHRPLLAFSRAQLQSYAQQQQLQWVEDDSNNDTRFERNFVRQQLTPVLRQRWPQFSHTASRSMQHLAQLQQLVEYYTAQAAAQCVQDNWLSLTELATLLPLQQDLVLRHWLKNYDLNPQTQWLQTLKQQVIAAREDATPQLQLADYQLRRFADRLYLLRDIDLLQPEHNLQWHGETHLEIPAGCGSLTFGGADMPDALPLNISTAEIMFGQLSARFTPAGADMSKPLKQWFKLWQVPPWQRQRIPLLFANNKLVAVAGYASSIAAQHASIWCSWAR